MSGIYLHIPFCKTRCGYCDFFSTTQLELCENYARAVAAELERERGFLEDKALRTVYFGGGTPSLLPPRAVGRLLEKIDRIWGLGDVEEVTLEANPDDLTEEYLSALASTPVGRISLGIQSFDDELLKFMNRRHSASVAVEAVERARRHGFKNISIDLIYGIPGMSLSQWRDSLDRAIALRPEHISAYHLTIEPGTAFGRRGLSAVDDQVSEEHFRMLRETLCGAGYEHYEISNFTLPGLRSRHNSSYWNGESYLGVGPSAHSYDGGRLRRWNSQPLTEYLAGPAYQSEMLSDDELWNEYIMTRLRTSQGISLQQLAVRFGPQSLSGIEKGVARWLQQGVVKSTAQGYAIDPANFLVSDAVIASLFR